MGAELALTNIVTVSVAAAQVGVNEYNTSNLALFTRDTPNGSFPVAGYAFYQSPDDVGTDFGTDSATYKMALAVFSQQPNILAGGGQLIVIAFLSAEELADAITRMADVVQFFGIMQAEIDSQTYTLQAATVIQSLNKVGFFVFRDTADIATDGTIDLLRQGGFTKSRGLYYGGADDESALKMQAAYAGRALSTNFDGSNTTQTMHMKDLSTILPDPSMTQTILNAAEAAGADVYASFEGIAKVFCSGANKFYDQVYNLGWFVGALQVAVANVLMTVPTKIPQTEGGMSMLKSAARKVCEQAITNQYGAPGSWTLPNTFGNQQDFFDNILQRGYYIFSQAVNAQSTAARAAREAPLMQIALKEAGAIHSADVLVTVNA